MFISLNKSVKSKLLLSRPAVALQAKLNRVEKIKNNFVKREATSKLLPIYIIYLAIILAVTQQETFLRLTVLLCIIRCKWQLKWQHKRQHKWQRMAHKQQRVMLAHTVIIQMKEAITALSKQQNFTLQQLFTQLRLDPATAAKTQKYYRQLRRIATNSAEPIALDSLMKTAILIAQQSQELFSITGQRIRGLHMAMNQIIRSTSNFKAIVSALGLYLTFSKSAEGFREDLEELADQLNFGSNFVTKFKKTMEYFDCVQEEEQNGGYRNLFESFSWLMFLNMREAIPMRSSTELDYLLISVLYIMVRYAHPYLRIRKMPVAHNNKVLIASILEQLFSIFVIDDPICFKKVNAQADSYFQYMFAAEILRCRVEYDFLCPSLIRNNYKRLDALYQRDRDSTAVDFRMFLTTRLATLTPSKNSRVSPSKGVAGQIQAKPQNFASHRILSFQNEGESKASIPTGPKQIKLPSNVRVSPSYIKTPLLCAQRTSPTLTIELYMSRVVKANQYRLQLLDNEAQVLAVISNILLSLRFDESTLATKIKATFDYYLVLQTNFINEEDYGEQDLNGIYCSTLVHALILTASQKCPHQQQLQSFLRSTLLQTRREIEVSGHHLWMVTSYLLKDSCAPPKLKELLVSLELQCVNQYLWKDATVQRMRHQFHNQHQSREANCLFANLSVRVRKQVKKLIDKLALAPEFTSYSHLLSQNTYQSLLSILADKPQILINRHLHQIVLCTCYRTIKAEQPEIRFNQLIQVHQLANHISNEELRHIIYRVMVSNADGYPCQANIIEFYNQCYLPFAKLLPTHHQTICAISQGMKTEGNQPRFSGLTKRGSLAKKLSHPNTQIEKAQQPNAHGRTKQEQCEQSARQGQKQTQKDKHFREIRQETRDETRQRERAPGAYLQWLQTEKSKSGGLR